MGGKELEYIKEAFETNWIAPIGPSVFAFENEMAQYIGVDHSLALSSGTAAIHLALRYLGVGAGDIVFCSDFTFIGSCVPILYEKATPEFIDCEPDTWNMSPEALEKAFKWAEKQGKLPKAIIIVDLYGESADWDSLLPLCRKYNVPVIEDAAEAVGAVYKGKKCGSFGDISALSFNGNKIITTSGGGMVLSNNRDAIKKMRFWSTQAREPVAWYEHIEYGYNYRMSNICACIGRGQLEYLDEKLIARKKIHEAYSNRLQVKQSLYSNHWLNLLVSVNPEGIVARLYEAGIEARHAWKPMHMQPIFRDVTYIGDGIDEKIFNETVCLPSGDTLTEEQIDTIIKCIA
jgi:pyridoxal phosphate-dependent aminotransferase EpsN